MKDSHNFSSDRRLFLQNAGVGSISMGAIMFPTLQLPIDKIAPIMKMPRIKEVIITPIATVDPPLLNAAGLHAPYALRIVVEIITEDNISGVSEIPGNASTNDALNGAVQLLTGMDPFQLNSIRQKLIAAYGKET
ncbi:MAG TPA: hypothetical protein VJ184_07445, partial [Chryseolinea sp.]|nr:hypothetical protein [Chryseolinea sp.]